jgi:hypothetical protein
MTTMSDGAPWELSDGAPWIAGAYRVPLAEPESCDLSIPEMRREWDYVLDHNMTRYELEHAKLLIIQGRRPPGYRPGRGWEGEASLAYYARTDTELVVRRGRGVVHPEVTLPEGLGYQRRARLALEVPAAARAAARQYAHDGPRICILPAGSGPAAWWPSPGSWIEILDALRGRVPGSRFYITGTRHLVGTATSLPPATTTPVWPASSPQVTTLSTVTTSGCGTRSLCSKRATSLSHRTADSRLLPFVSALHG